jgi:predicted Zn-dependent protease with MMP-like domain
VSSPELEALLDELAADIDAVNDDDEAANQAIAERVWKALERCRGDEKLLLDAWELVPEAIISYASVWPEEQILTAAREDLGADDPVYSLLAGLFAFYDGRWKEAEKHLRAVPDDAVAAHWLGCALERLGREKEADRELARAAKIDEERFSKPIRMSDSEFRECVEAAFAELPEEFRSAVLSNGTLMVESFPNDHDVAEGGDPLTLGVFRGEALLEREVGAPSGPSDVVLYKKNLEKIAASRDDLIEEARTTLFHEIGHALGFEEDGVDDLGLA